MKFDDRVKTYASLPCLFFFTVYLTNGTAMTLVAHVNAFFVG